MLFRGFHVHTWQTTARYKEEWNEWTNEQIVVASWVNRLQSCMNQLHTLQSITWPFVLFCCWYNSVSAVRKHKDSFLGPHGRPRITGTLNCPYPSNSQTAMIPRRRMMSSVSLYTLTPLSEQTFSQKRTFEWFAHACLRYIGRTIRRHVIWIGFVIDTIWSNDSTWADYI